MSRFPVVGVETLCDTVRNKVVSALFVRRQIIFLKFFSALLLTAFYSVGWLMNVTPSVVAVYAPAECVVIDVTGGWNGRE